MILGVDFGSLVRNNWGTEWGLGGYALLDINSRACNLMYRWSHWESGNVSVNVRFLSMYVSNRDWTVKLVRKPVYNFVSGPRWRFDFSIENRIPEKI